MNLSSATILWDQDLLIVPEMALDAVGIAASSSLRSVSLLL